MWKHAPRHVLYWIALGLGVYLLYFVAHRFVTSNASLPLLALWIGSGAILFYLWQSHMQKWFKVNRSWVTGFAGEHAVQTTLRALPKEYHVFSDVRLPSRGGNIDFVVVCPYGVYAVEVKTWARPIQSLWFKYGKQAWTQSHKEALALYAVLAAHHPHWIQSVLVLTRQNNFLPRVQSKVHVIGGTEIAGYFTQEVEQHTKQRLSSDEIINIVGALDEIADCRKCG